VVITAYADKSFNYHQDTASGVDQESYQTGQGFRYAASIVKVGKITRARLKKLLLTK
jgi:hypothetical protein